METLLQPLIEAFPRYVIEKQLSPSYVRIFTKNANEDVTLVCEKSKPTQTDSNKQCINDAKEEFELTGSPLKLDLSLHTLLDETLSADDPQLWSKEEGLHLPVSVDQAREVANRYNNTLRKEGTDENAIPMWILCSPKDEQRTLLLMAKSYKDYFVRGLVKFDGTFLLDDISVEALIKDYATQEMLTSDLVTVIIDCKFILSGASYSHIARSPEELVNAPYGSSTELHCEWTGNSIHIPTKACKVTFEQEVIVGHLASPCNSIWKSICALHSINQLLVDMNVVGFNAVNLESSQIRRDIPGTKRPDNVRRLNELLNEVEGYAYSAQSPEGGCICVTEDLTSLKQCLDAMDSGRSSNDFTYCLWDILKDCETAEELIFLLIQALKFISSGRIRPFIDANNKTYLSKLVLKLARGHSQAPKVLKNLQSNPPQALSLVGQVGVEKTMWEYTQIISLVEHSFFIAGIWNSDFRSPESVEQINQTIQDMTMSGGDFTLNPFESLSHTADLSIRLDGESFYDNIDPNELSVDEFASLKKHGLVGDKKTPNEVPLIADEIDITPWKNLLMKFAQVHVCLEHLFRAQVCLRSNFVNLKPLATRLLEHYVQDRSSVKTVGQLMNEPAQRISLPIATSMVEDHLKKPVSWYRVEINRKEDTSDVGLKRDARIVYAFTQQPVFPPAVWQNFEPKIEEVAEMTMGEDLKYHCTKFTLLSNRLPNKLPL